jgi:hypothetical protein
MAMPVVAPTVVSSVASASLVPLGVLEVPPLIVPVAETRVATVAIVAAVVTVVSAMIVMDRRSVDDGNGNGEREEDGQWEDRPDGHCRAFAVIGVRECGGGGSQSDQQSCSQGQ